MKYLLIFFLILVSSFTISCNKGKTRDENTKNGKSLSREEIREFFKLIKDSNFDKVKKLISDNNAYVFAVDSSIKEYQSPLNVAVIRGYNSIAEILIKSNANLNYKDVYGNSALHYCAKVNNIEIAKMLLEHKADVNIQNLSKETPLHFAARYNHLEMVKLLLEYKANPQILNESGKTPYDLAKENNSTKVLELLK